MDCGVAAVADRFAVVVRPHPRLSEPMLAPLRQANLAICWDDTATLVPLCDLYVASISATIRWAIACGKPVVNYDVFQYRFDDYDGVPGNILVNDIASFRQALSELAANPERLAALASGAVDGRAGLGLSRWREQPPHAGADRSAARAGKSQGELASLYPTACSRVSPSPRSSPCVSLSTRLSMRSPTWPSGMPQYEDFSACSSATPCDIRYPRPADAGRAKFGLLLGGEHPRHTEEVGVAVAIDIVVHDRLAAGDRPADGR